MTFTQCWCHYTVDMNDKGTPQATYDDSMNLVFANCSEKNAIYPLTIREIVESQLADITMGQLKTKPGYSVQLVKAPWSYAKMTNLSSPRIYKWEQLYGTTITFSTQAPLVSKRLFAVQCIGRVWDIPSNHMSRSVTVARWTNDTCRSMVNCQPNSLSSTLGRCYVWILLDHTPSRARMVHNWLYVCYNDQSFMCQSKTSTFTTSDLPFYRYRQNPNARKKWPQKYCHCKWLSRVVQQQG